MKKSIFREYAEALIIALILAVFIRTFVVQAFKIPSGSMLPTLQIGDHILVSKFAYGIKNPFSDENIISFSPPKQEDIIVFKYPVNPKIDYIKRVVGVAGDRIEIKDKKVYINDKLYKTEQAVYQANNIVQSNRDNYGPVTVPANSLFVMGDNRDNSRDSRFWGFVNYKLVKGKAFIVYWSWDLDKYPNFSFKRFATIRWSRFGNIID